MTIHRISMAAYLADPAEQPSLSSSIAHKLITRSPLHAWRDHPRLGGAVREDSGVADIGTVAHDLLLGGEGKICVIDPNNYPSTTGTIPDGWTNKAIRAARDQARANGLTPILAGAMAGARAMVKAAHEFIATSEIAGVFDAGEAELTVIEQIDGVWLRCRPDWMSDRYLLHYKTTKASAAPEAFIRGIMPSMGYDMAMAFYAVCTPMSGRLHRMLVQEQDAPYACSLIALSPALLEISLLKVRRAIALWEQCMLSGTWPGYSSRVHYAEPTPWALAAAESAMSEP